MSNGSDAADQVVRYTLEGTEVALKRQKMSLHISLLF